MVLTGKIKRVAFYCRMNHRDHDYSQFFEEVRAMIEQRYGTQKWELHHYFEVASGADPNRVQFGKLKSEVIYPAASCGIYDPRAVAKWTCKHVRLARCLREN